MTVAATLLLSSAVYAGNAVTVGSNGVDVVAAASEPWVPATTAPKPGTTTPVAVATELTRTLVLNSKGADVKLVQTLLNSKGYALVVDGMFGAKTAAAVKDFQAKNGLTANGIVDQLTFLKLKPVVVAVPVPAVPVPVVPVPVVPAKPMGIYPDVVASASCNLTTEKELQSSLGATGTWITTLGSDVVVPNDLVWTGDVRKEGATAPARKLGLYYHATPNIGGEQLFTLKVPNLIVSAENANLSYGILDGNVKVQAKGFKLTNCTITGQLEFATQEQYDSALFNEIIIKGDVLVAGTKLTSALKPQTITNYGKYDEAAAKGDMMKASVTFKDGKAHDVLIDVMGPSYFVKPGILTSGGQGNWGKVAYSKAGQYVMVKPTLDRPASTIFAWDKQISTLITAYKKSGFDMSKFPTVQRDATHPSVLDFNKMLDGKYKAYTVSETNGAIDSIKLKGVERTEVVKVDAITSCSVDIGKYMKLADTIIKAGTK